MVVLFRSGGGWAEGGGGVLNVKFDANKSKAKEKKECEKKTLNLQFSDTQKGNPNSAHYGTHLWQIITLNYNSAASARTVQFFPCASNLARLKLPWIFICRGFTAQND